ncbi:helix-turn-helix domain-containing protein [Flavobacterium sp.]|uniref:helix-turn-helix domain-containing protein n=1 Tax=Flavobacterium sp. TaxID=239 RepID=UPI0025F45A88|nr:helix-turn-helix domain-containing protein [Flavobacterium sp.]
METLKKEYRVSDYFERTDENFSYEKSFRRWLVFEIETKKMTIKEATENFNISYSTVYKWRNKYAREMVLPLQDMTAEEKQKMELVQKQLKEAEKQLADASIPPTPIIFIKNIPI